MLSSSVGECPATILLRRLFRRRCVCRFRRVLGVTLVRRCRRSGRTFRINWWHCLVVGRRLIRGRRSLGWLLSVLIAIRRFQLLRIFPETLQKFIKSRGRALRVAGRTRLGAGRTRQRHISCRKLRLLPRRSWTHGCRCFWYLGSGQPGIRLLRRRFRELVSLLLRIFGERSRYLAVLLAGLFQLILHFVNARE